MPPVETDFAVLVELGGLLGHQHDLVGLAVVVEPQGPDRPFGEHRLLQLEGLVGDHRADRGQVGEQLDQGLGQRPDLLLLELQGDELIVLASLQVEGPLADASDGADSQALHGGEIE